ncbi:MAG: dihydroorotate dehydrogenase [Clostridia bacterium]|nr:dihydroorotate dehydrogenase [Clostridia bacterium]
MADLYVTLAGLALKNPVIPASGCFGYGAEFAELYDLNVLGALAVKGTTENARFGNAAPRIADCPAGMLNAVGLQNPGIDAVVSGELPRLKKVYHGPVIANISGFSVPEYVRCCEKACATPGVSIIEVNVSCPNVHGGGLSFGSAPENAAEVTRAVKAVSDKPVFIKLSPNVSDISEIAKACEDAGADGLTLINTLLGMRIDKKTRRPVLANITGGLSGPAVFPVALRMIWQVFEAVNIPIIGCGGISSAEDVIEMMLAGASAVEIGSANLRDPFACRDIIAALPEAMANLGIDKLRDITGGAH